MPELHLQLDGPPCTPLPAMSAQPTQVHSLSLLPVCQVFYRLPDPKLSLLASGFPPRPHAVPLHINVDDVAEQRPH